MNSNFFLFRLLFGILIYFLATLWMLYLSIEANKILELETDLTKNETLNYPTEIEELKSLSYLLKAKYSKHANFILILYSSAYLYKQTFAIPGSILLNLLAGSLFGLWYGFMICCSLNTLGALSCFFLSKIVGEAIENKFFKTFLFEIRKLTNKQDTYSLLIYLTSIRIFPATPNWLMNMFCPFIGIPWYFFAFSCIGLFPQIYICVQTGEILSELTSIREMYSPSIAIQSTLAATTVLILAPLIRVLVGLKSRQTLENILLNLQNQ